MSHLAGRCTCGKKIHYPKGSELGTTWTCWRCGKVWTISTEGDPLHNARSKAPPETTYTPTTFGTTATDNIPWWGWLIAILFVLWLVGVIIDFIALHWVAIVSIIGVGILLFLTWILRRQIGNGLLALGRILRDFGQNIYGRYSSRKQQRKNQTSE